MLDADDARRFEATAGRPPLYWDNYPVNDVAMGWELHIGPYRGRDADLARPRAASLANAMELAEASKIPLATIADYLARPAGYDPEASWRRAIRDVAAGRRRTDARPSRRSPRTCAAAASCDEDAPTVTARARGVRCRRGRRAETATRGCRRRRDLRALARASSGRRGPPARRRRSRTRRSIDECRPWIEAFEVGRPGHVPCRRPRHARVASATATPSPPSCSRTSRSCAVAGSACSGTRSTCSLPTRPTPMSGPGGCSRSKEEELRMNRNIASSRSSARARPCCSPRAAAAAPRPRTTMCCGSRWARPARPRSASGTTSRRSTMAAHPGPRSR